MSYFTFTLTDQTVLAVLNRIARSFTPARMRPAMKEIGEELAESTRRRFATASGPDGAPWKPLKPGTVLARYRKMMTGFDANKGNRKKDGSLSKRGAEKALRNAQAAKRPLIATGELSRGIRYQVTDGGAGVEIGTNRTFGNGIGAEVHQFGTRDGRIPARPFLGLSPKDKTMVLDILNELLNDAAHP
ncbi:MAG: phage virion morphogenesis protein [Azoarcus sp.]|jgi:phage gpG-like protein|nr:phage virion morphogenesis protein [Azoarcus sp.]